MNCDKELVNRRAKRCRPCSAIGKNKGKSPSLEVRKKLSNALKGEKSHLWRGGLTSKSILIRTSFEYRTWRTSVFIRDGRRCVLCKSTNKIEADHIKPFALFPELRLDVNNGRTLCHECHKNTDSYFGNFHINKIREKYAVI